MVGPGIAKCASSADDRYSNIQAKKARFLRLQAELVLSNREAALLLLGSKFKESTVRGWTNPHDFSRQPTDEAIEKLEALAAARALEAFALRRAR
jgi:hypothetical protein